MKFNCGPTWQEKAHAKEQWHRWFAWHPVRIGLGDCRWLEYVERQGERQYDFGGWTWFFRYRELHGPDNHLNR